jgi:hypothetical protein
MDLRRVMRRIAYVVVALLVVTRFTPAALAFPYVAQINGTTVRAEQPIDAAALARVVSHSDALVAASPLDTRESGGQVYLTNGGWRWHLLALNSAGAFGISFPVTETILINNADLARDRVTNGATIAGQRTLSAVLAHERTHGLIRKRYGLLADARYPAWLREGYCDSVARESTLSDAQAEALLAKDESVPALAYHQGRKRVERELATSSVDALFTRYQQF